MHKVKHVGHHKAQETANREVLVEHRDTYEQWRALLEAEHIINAAGLVDLEKLEKRYPDTLTKSQIVWIEAMQKGEIIEEGDDVVLDEPIEDDEPAEEVPKVSGEAGPGSAGEKVEKVVDVEEEEVAEEVEKEEVEVEETDEDLAPPPLPGEKKVVVENKEKTEEAEEKEYAVGDSFNILVEEDGEPVEVTVAKITKDGIHLAPSNDDTTEYLVDPAELAEMIVD